MTDTFNTSDKREKDRTRCPNCRYPQPWPDEWETVDEGGRPDLCWGDPMVCADRIDETYAGLRTALERLRGLLVQHNMEMPREVVQEMDDVILKALA